MYNDVYYLNNNLIQRPIWDYYKQLTVALNLIYQPQTLNN